MGGGGGRGRRLIPHPGTFFIIFKSVIKRDSHTDLSTSFSHFEKNSPQPKIKVRLESRFNLRSVFLDFQSLAKKPVFIIFG